MHDTDAACPEAKKPTGERFIKVLLVKIHGLHLGSLGPATETPSDLVVSCKVCHCGHFPRLVATFMASMSSPTILVMNQWEGSRSRIRGGGSPSSGAYRDIDTLAVSCESVWFMAGAPTAHGLAKAHSL